MDHSIAIHEQYTPNSSLAYVEDTKFTFKLTCQGQESSYFSLFALTDKSASFLGPFIVGVIADVTGNIRLGFLFLLVMLLIPVPVLMRLRVK